MTSQLEAAEARLVARGLLAPGSTFTALSAVEHAARAPQAVEVPR